MEIFEKNKKSFIALGVVAVLVIVYFSFFSGSDNVISTTPSESVVTIVVNPGDSPVADMGPQLIALLTELQGIRLDYTLFEDPVFLALTDQSRPLEPQALGKALGRTNPFSDFTGASASVSTEPSAGQTGVNGSKLIR